MTLAPGARQGSYEILSPLGRGGMGEVYRARDTRLGRDVAIKILPEEFARDPERLARFQREARVVASLNHPNIAAIYGLEEAGGEKYLILECVEGETLAEKLSLGPLPVQEAIGVCAQIALGLEAAHEAAVIHRDLKPGNVKIRPDGAVKVLDFGLAKAGAARSGPDADSTKSPTVTSATEKGVILGTAAYMSPEQARGASLDRRSDVFSFGAVLYECLTGQRAFAGQSVSDTLAAILKSDPDWTHLPEETPERVRQLLRRCLRKDTKQRLHDIGDARIELEEALAVPEPRAPEGGGAAAGRTQRFAAPLWIATGLAAGVLATWLWGRRAPPTSSVRPAPPVHFSISLPAGTELLQSPYGDAGMAFSPDGQHLVFPGRRERVQQLYLRRMDRAEATPIPGTEGGVNPFFSPDGEWIGFFASSYEIRKVPLAGGQPLKVCDVPPVANGASWAQDGTIFFNSTYVSGLSRVPAAGGDPVEFTTPDRKAGEHGHLWPQVLPGGKDILFVVRAGQDFQDIGNSKVVVQSLETGRRTQLLEGVTSALWVPPGWLLFVRGRALFAARSMPGSWRPEGTPVRVTDEVLVGAVAGQASFVASAQGALLYATGSPIEPDESMLVWTDRKGREEVLPLPPGNYSTPRLAPDGMRLALMVRAGPRVSVWIHDFRRNLLSPLTTEPGRFLNPAWSPDGTRLAFTRLYDGEPRLAWKPADGSGPLEHLTKGESPEFSDSFSPDGRSLLYAMFTAAGANPDIGVLSLEGPRASRAFLATPFREVAAFFSPDGRWVAYTSDETGQSEVYVRPYPGPGAPLRVSTDGGVEPLWSADGRELFYRRHDSYLVVAVRASHAGLEASAPRVLFAGNYVHGGSEDAPREYDISRDGKRFLFIKPVESKREPIRELHIVTNWPALLEGRNGERP